MHMRTYCSITKLLLSLAIFSLTLQTFLRISIKQQVHNNVPLTPCCGHAEIVYTFQLIESKEGYR